jgi:1-phosphatidylinositol-4-phosphate 5-kinase
LRVVRWKKKRTGHLKKKKSYVKGKVIDGEHELYTLSIAVMIGVRTSISRTNTELNCLKPPLKRWVNPSDFRMTEKYEFHPKGGDGPLLPPHQLAHTFKFKDYCPVVFAYLRRMYGVNEFDFLLSVCGNANFIEFISNAKSGQFFFYSSDGRYMIKTMTNAESKFLRQILPEYFKHCCENPNTLVTRFFGMYRVKLYHLRRNVKFVIMNSVYYTDKNLQTFYDLKGSSVGRDAKPGQAVLKDNDLRKRLPDDALALRPEQRSCMRNQLEADCSFLTRMDVMDYSMLVGVHYVPPFEGRASLTYRKSCGGAGRGLGGLRIRRNTGGSSTNYGHNDDSDATSNEGEPNILQKQNTSQTSGCTASPLRQKPPPSEVSSASTSPVIGNTKSPQRPPSLSGQNRARSEDKLVSASMLSNNVSKSPLRPPTVSGSARSRSDTWGMSTQLEDGLEDDDNSYLHGSTNRPTVGLANVDEETERKKQATVEKLFWPFHNLYDIHGHRRLQPVQCNVCQNAPCGCDDAYQSSLLAGYNIPKFVPPISDRKDGGLEMDTTGLQLPCTIKGGAPNGDLMFDGKIFYMGVIDILQEYNTRKEIESVYRMIQSSSKLAASCVAPLAYGRRFINFFDQYTERPVKVDLAEQGQEVSFRV